MIFIDSANFSSFFFFSFLEKQGKHLDNRLGRLVFTLRDIKNRSICRKESIKSWRIFRFTDISLITSLFFSGVWKHICINVQFLWRQVAMATTFIPVDPLHYTSQQREGSRFPVGFIFPFLVTYIHVTGILREDIVMRTTKQTFGCYPYCSSTAFNRYFVRESHFSQWYYHRYFPSNKPVTRRPCRRC